MGVGCQGPWEAAFSSSHCSMLLESSLLYVLAWLKLQGREILCHSLSPLPLAASTLSWSSSWVAQERGSRSFVLTSHQLKFRLHECCRGGGKQLGRVRGFGVWELSDR